MDVGDTADYLRSIAQTYCQASYLSYDYGIKQLKVQNLDNLEKYIGIQLPPNKKKIAFNLFSTDSKDYRNSFFYNQSSEVYSRFFTEINFIGKQIKTPEMYKEYILTKSL